MRTPKSSVTSRRTKLQTCHPAFLCHRGPFGSSSRFQRICHPTFLCHRICFGVMATRTSWDDFDEDDAAAGMREGAPPTEGVREGGIPEGPVRSRRRRAAVVRHEWDDDPATMREGPAVVGEAVSSSAAPVGDSSDSDWEACAPNAEEEFCQEIIYLFLGRTLNAR